MTLRGDAVGRAAAGDTVAAMKATYTLGLMTFVLPLGCVAAPADEPPAPESLGTVTQAETLETT